MKNKLLKLLIIGFLILLTVGYIYYFRPMVDDELFSYGFSYNIINGLIPYKDFNMIITPLYIYLLGGVLKIFGSHLLVYHFVLALSIVLITYISYKTIGKKAIVIYILPLIYPYTGYNIFVLLLLFLIFYYLDKNKKNTDNIEAIIIGLMILTKQTLVLLVIPSLILAKNKKRVFSIYLVYALIFLGYLVINGTVFEFFDYCLFGMFDFAEKNGTGIDLLFIVESIIIIILTYFYIKTKRKDIAYTLFFQIMAFPIVNQIHFIISFVPVVYLFLKEFRDNEIATILCFTLSISFFITFNFITFFKDDNYLYLKHYDVNNFMEGRATFSFTKNYVFKINDFINEYDGYNPYLFGHFAYLVKLNNNIPINKYDLINDGNMGYDGANKYMSEIDKYCKSNDCIFFINNRELELTENVQTNKKILEYVVNNYNQKFSSNVFDVYTN